ncbi:MAG: PIG-L family deacetylase [Candidatus Hydrogenedentes bacterium]|nr:PIG-L family deacetylase [Candidatus Hydrogenedentota bacterium]
MMAGTLFLLGQAGFELHMMNIANGSCGSATMDKDTTIATRLGEARDAAKALGAILHEPLVDDLEIFYGPSLLRRVAAVIREVNPAILLLHSPQDYMEDHMNACRLALSAAFSRGMRNYTTDPPRPAVEGEVTVYHALPYGLRDGLRQRIEPHLYVDISEVLPRKREALACHRSQKEWLDHSQGLDSYLITMEDMSREVGRWSRQFAYAEGWRRHLHLGFCGEGADPLVQSLGAKALSRSE